MIDELAAKVPPSAAQNVGRSPIRTNLRWDIVALFNGRKYFLSYSSSLALGEYFT